MENFDILNEIANVNRELFFDSLKNQSPEINQESNGDSLHQSEEADVNNVMESSETEYERQQWNVTNATKISWNKSIQGNDELSNFFVPNQEIEIEPSQVQSFVPQLYQNQYFNQVQAVHQHNCQFEKMSPPSSPELLLVNQGPLDLTPPQDQSPAFHPVSLCVNQAPLTLTPPQDQSPAWSPEPHVFSPEFMELINQPYQEVKLNYKSRPARKTKVTPTFRDVKLNFDTIKNMIHYPLYFNHICHEIHYVDIKKHAKTGNFLMLVQQLMKKCLDGNFSEYTLTGQRQIKDASGRYTKVPKAKKFPEELKQNIKKFILETQMLKKETELLKTFDKYMNIIFTKAFNREQDKERKQRVAAAKRASKN